MLPDYALYPDTNAAPLFLLTITSSVNRFHVVNNNEDIVSRGVTYTAYPFSLILPEDSDDAVPNITLTIDNVDQMLVESIRSETDPISVKVELIWSNNPDVVEKSIDFLRIVQVTYDSYTISASLKSVDLMNLIFIKETYNPTEFMGIFY